MNHSDLSSLILALEHGTKLHISLVFFDRFGNSMTRLAKAQKIHTSPMCDLAKNSGHFQNCLRCRETMLRLARAHKKPFGGYCVNGIYEYCHPVCIGQEVAAVILIGNLFDGSPAQHRRLEKHFDSPMTQTMESILTRKDCPRLAGIIESYLRFLFKSIWS